MKSFVIRHNLLHLTQKLRITMEQITLNGTACKLFACGTPEALLIQPSARHEEKNDGLQREADLIAKASKRAFAIVFFDCGEWARALMPWEDEAVSRDSEVGHHATDTLLFIERSLLPYLHARYGNLPCIIGGYSLGALFALWAVRNSTSFAAVAAASPSLWIRGWGEYAASHPILALGRCASNAPQRGFYVHISLGESEEHCRNQRMQRIGDCVRAEYALLSSYAPEGDTHEAESETYAPESHAPNAQAPRYDVQMRWHKGGHFGAEAERTAEAFAWCLNNVKC